jgi:hypothetical protein
MALNCNETRGLGPLQVFDAVLDDPAEQERFNRERRGPEVKNPVIMVHHYLDSRPRIKKEVEWFAQHSSLERAISDAAMSIDWEKKRFSHQHRIKRIVLESARKRLLSITRKLGECKNFDELYGIVENALEPVDGAGELYSYDVSLRIGSKLGLFPRKVFLHAGTRKGAKALGLNGQLSWLEMDSLPEWLRELQPYEVEDFLCSYKDRLVYTMSARES